VAEEPRPAGSGPSRNDPYRSWLPGMAVELAAFALFAAFIISTVVILVAVFGG
jgi:hypothetical protein